MNASYSSLSRGTAGLSATPGVGPPVGEASVIWPVSLECGFKRKKTKPRSSCHFDGLCSCRHSLSHKLSVQGLGRELRTQPCLCECCALAVTEERQTVYIPGRAGVRVDDCGVC